MEIAGPIFVLVEVLAWGLGGLSWEAPCCGPCAVTLWWSLVPWMDQGPSLRKLPLNVYSGSGRKIAWSIVFLFGFSLLPGQAGQESFASICC